MNEVVLEKRLSSGIILQLVHGDLTKESVDAIVNAANAYLAHGAGVAGAICRAGGPQIQSESEAWVQQHGPVSHSEPAYTRAGNLPCKYVIHAVGPVWGSGDEKSKLSAAIDGSLRLADGLHLHSIAFPPISTGIFGFPKKEAALVFLDTLHAYFSQNPNASLQQVRLTIIDQQTLNEFLRVWKERIMLNQ